MTSNIVPVWIKWHLSGALKKSMLRPVYDDILTFISRPFHAWLLQMRNYNPLRTKCVVRTLLDDITGTSLFWHSSNFPFASRSSWRNFFRKSQGHRLLSFNYWLWGHPIDFLWSGVISNETPYVLPEQCVKIFDSWLTRYSTRECQLWFKKCNILHQELMSIDDTYLQFKVLGPGYM